MYPPLRGLERSAACWPAAGKALPRSRRTAAASSEPEMNPELMLTPLGGSQKEIHLRVPSIIYTMEYYYSNFGDLLS